MSRQFLGALGAVVVAMALSFSRQGSLDPVRSGLVLGAAVLVQVITNLQNDVGYTVRGCERSGNRRGLPRATAQDLVGGDKPIFLAGIGLEVAERAFMATGHFRWEGRMTHFLVTEENPKGYKLEDIFSMIRKDIMTRALKIADDNGAEARRAPPHIPPKPPRRHPDERTLPRRVNPVGGPRGPDGRRGPPPGPRAPREARRRRDFPMGQPHARRHYAHVAHQPPLPRRPAASRRVRLCHGDRPRREPRPQKRRGVQMEDGGLTERSTRLPRSRRPAISLDNHRRLPRPLTPYENQIVAVGLTAFDNDAAPGIRCHRETDD